MRSGTTAYVAEQWGRRWITCDTSRVALALARTRLMAAKYPYYLLADSPEGAKKEAETIGTLTPALSQWERGHFDGDIKKGFVCKRVPHVMLKSIANNEEIDVIHAKWQPKQDAVREKLNKALKTQWEERRILFSIHFALMHSTSNLINTSFPTITPPLSSALFQFTPKSLRFTLPSAVNPARVLPQGSLFTPLKLPTSVISFVTP
jgi:hypothetical protein